MTAPLSFLEREFHPCAEIFPLTQGAEFDVLVEDVREHGVRQPLWLHSDGRIVDGRNRHRTAKAAGCTCEAQEYEGSEEELLAFVVSQIFHRRHLNESQRAIIAARMNVSPAVGQRRRRMGEVSAPLYVQE